jgi:hypothetical protein
MRHVFSGFLVCLIVASLCAISVAKNEMGIADVYKVTFTQQILVADTLLPQGDYEIRHVMEGSNHIMVFRQLKTKTPLEVRAKCTLVPLGEKAAHNQTSYQLNAANVRVLQEMVFRGDRAKHVF